MSLSLLPVPLNGIMIGLILYGLLRSYTAEAVKRQLEGAVRDPLPAISTLLGLFLGGIGLYMKATQDPLPLQFSWLPSAGATLILYSVGMPFLKRFIKT